MSLLIKNAKAVVDSSEVVDDCQILLEEDRISEVGPEVGGEADKVIDASGMAAIPGLVNTHTHGAMTLLRSYADDMPLMEWLEKKIWPLEANLEPEDILAGTRLACLEMIRSGTTTMSDMYFQPEMIARACSDMGIRAVVAAAFFDFMDPDCLQENLKKALADIELLKSRYDNGLIRPALGPHAPYTVSLDGLRQAMEMAHDQDVLVHFHLAETEKEILDFKKEHGKGVIRALEEIDFLNERLLAAHCVYLDEGDVKTLAKYGVSASHNPVSNMKLSSGRAMPFSLMKKHGLNVSLGTDGASSNNNLNLGEGMKFAALLQKHHYMDPTLLDAKDAFDMATIGGARALKLDTGMLRPDYLADIVLIDLERAYMKPGHNLISDLVYSWGGRGVSTVIINGKVVMENGRVEGEEKIMKDATEAAMDLVERG